MNPFIETIKRDNPDLYADYLIRKKKEDRYLNYEVMRKSGLTHEQLVSIGMGNDEMKERYEEEQI